jgi:hypothetical protein
MNNFKIYFRISSRGNPLGRTELSNTELAGITRQDCFNNLLKVFGTENLIVIADNADDDVISFLQSKGIENIDRTSFGNTLSFRYILDRAVSELDEDDIAYFLEDDYAHNYNAETIIREGLEIGDYVSLYDSRDKYKDTDKGGYNPFIHDGGEDTRVMITDTCHWKITNATTMSFASKIKTLREDYGVITKYCPNGAQHPMDFLMFRELVTQKNRKLINPIPGYSAHIGLEMSPFVPWIKLLKGEL